MSAYPKMTLKDDPKSALEQVAAYLRTVRTGPDRIVRDAFCGLRGYWQTPEWTEGLAEIVEECDRVRGMGGKANRKETRR